LERALWQIMVRTQTLPWHIASGATPGQFTWVYLNQLIDYDERVEKIHSHCLPKFLREVCEVCHQPLIDESELDPEVRDQIYRPSEDREQITDQVYRPREHGQTEELVVKEVELS
jgi:hypothetical protein